MRKGLASAPGTRIPLGTAVCGGRGLILRAAVLLKIKCLDPGTERRFVPTLGPEGWGRGQAEKPRAEKSQRQAVPSTSEGHS